MKVLWTAPACRKKPRSCAVPNSELPTVERFELMWGFESSNDPHIDMERKLR